MEGRTTMVGIDRKSSIETEPRTLPIDLIDCAREAARNVVNTRSVEDASSIFTAGLEQTTEKRQMQKKEIIMSDAKLEHDGRMMMKHLPPLWRDVSAPF